MPETPAKTARPGRPISKETPVALLAKCLNRSYLQMAHETGLSYEKIRAAGKGRRKLSLADARRLAQRYGTSTDFVMGDSAFMLRVPNPEDRAKEYWLRNHDQFVEGWQPSIEPGGTSEAVVLEPSDRKTALMKALGDVARIANFVLPEDEQERANLAELLAANFSQLSLEDHSPAFKRAARLIKAFNAAWKRAPKAFQVMPLARYFEQRFYAHIPMPKLKANGKLAGLIETFLRDASSHPESPLIRFELIEYIMGARRRYGLPPSKN